MKTRVLILTLLCAAAVTAASAQEQQKMFSLKTLTATGQALFGVSPRSTFQSGSTGIGGGAEARLHLTGPISLSLEGGYQDYTIKQKSPVTNWNWVYWQKYYRSYINTDWLGSYSYFNGTRVRTSTLTDDQIVSGTPIVREDSIYQATFKAVQTMSVIPLGISVNAEIPVNAWLVPFVGAGASVYLYERTMYLDEHWTKRARPDAGIDSGRVYPFEYDFRNFATPIRGEVYAVSAKAGADLLVSRLIGFRFTAQYQGIIDAAGGASAARNFPFRGTFAATLGLVIRY
ncbi:MAG: hypothetical protein ACM3Q4_15685 [Acidobacteriota bacterium]